MRFRASLTATWTRSSKSLFLLLKTISEACITTHFTERVAKGRKSREAFLRLCTYKFCSQMSATIMEYYEQDLTSSFKPFGVVSNESLTVGVARNDSLRGGGLEERHSSPFSGGGGGRDRKKKLQQQRCSRSWSRRVGPGPTQSRGRGRVVLFATPQELGDRCVRFIKEQRSRLHIIRRCAVMLACWPKYR